jgi:hypothetical protein
MATLTFNKPTTNIQRAFGLFSLLQSKGYTRKRLNPSEPYIVIDSDKAEFYSSSTPVGDAIDIPADYPAMINAL